jgi:2-polyprenyl-6-methoxyphenol hydroxylase-like FAD-dependent oxidoreductase
MSAAKPITIVGGGLAGLTLGIGLRRQDVPVIVFEAGSYPRHRVCGEFVSGRGQRTLERMGLMRALKEAGAIPARTSAFFTSCSRAPVRALPSPALCVSRYTLDAQLAAQLRADGGELREKSARRDLAPGPGIMLASGRRLAGANERWRWYGIKCHANDFSLEADLEMHLAPNGYVGLCRLNDGEVNVCGLFRWRAPRESAGPAGPQLLRGAPGTLLAQRLQRAVFNEASFCAVAGLCPHGERTRTEPGCRLGDAWAMIPPVTGNGMSMAFESAELALAPLTAYSHGSIQWEAATSAIATACKRAFRNRLFWARWLHRLIFSDLLESRAGQFGLRSQLLWRMMFAHTR